MRVRLLGPVDVVVDAEPRAVQGLRRKAVLAVLALNHGVVVSTDHLIDAVWDGSAPETVANTLQRNVSHLRTVLGDRLAIVARPPGYLLAGEVEPTDAETAERLLAQAAACDDPRDRVRMLGAALALWRGPSLADVAELRSLAPHAQRLDHIQLQATRDLTDARLALGEHAQLLPDLERQAAEHPFDERAHGQLILALYRAGRQAEALAASRRLRTGLRDELGVDPGRDIRDLEAAVLRQDAELTAASPVTLSHTAARIPAELPPAVYGFAGRTAELATLDAIRAGAARDGSATAVAALVGGAGIGKTSLAVHWAHRIADQFPDGQLYVNLRGFDPSGPAMDPAEAVRRFLGSFEVPVSRIPVGLDAQAALYRSLLGGKRMLIVLDNASSAEQVRPLLPGKPGCLVVITSRDQLMPLIAVEGARPVPVGLLDEAEADELMARRLGAARVAAEPDAVREIVARCARLPLALGIAAARAAVRPQAPLADLAEELDRATALDAFTAGDASSDLRRVFSWSYAALSPEAARLFRLLGLHPGPDIGRAGATSLAGLPAPRARTLIAELVRANVLTEQAPGRYVMHDLLRAHARELAELGESENERSAALERAFDHYLRTAQVAAHELHGSWVDLELPPPAPGVTPERPAGIAAANAWLDAEHQVLLAAVIQSAEGGFPAYAWRLASTLSLVLDSRGFWHEYLEIHRAALDAVLATDDTTGQAHAHHGIGRAYSCLGQDDAALRHLNTALATYAALGDAAGQANVRLGIGFLADRKGDNATALSESEAALQLFRSAGHRSGEAISLGNIGWTLTLMGEHARALPFCEHGLALHQELGDPRGLAASWQNLGLVRQHLGQYAEAIDCYARGLALSREVADTYLEADLLHRMGGALQATGEVDRARAAWREALTLFDKLGHADADQVRYKLRHG